MNKTKTLLAQRRKDAKEKQKTEKWLLFASLLSTTNVLSNNEGDCK
jgi:hypothetical protein